MLMGTYFNIVDLHLRSNNDIIITVYDIFLENLYLTLVGGGSRHYRDMFAKCESVVFNPFVTRF